MGIADRLFNLKADQAAANLKAGQEFLTANKQKPGVTELQSGLQYEVTELSLAIQIKSSIFV